MIKPLTTAEQTMAMAERLRNLLDEIVYHEGVAVMALAVEIGRRIGESSETQDICKAAFRHVQEVAAEHAGYAMIERIKRRGKLA